MAATAIKDRLEARRTEIERAVLTRIQATVAPGEAADPEYAHGLRSAVSSAVDYGLSAIGRVDDRAPPIPTGLLGQARLAARSDITLDVVLRRYFAGYTLFADFVIQEVAAEGLGKAEFKRLLRAQASIFDKLVVCIGEEHRREVGNRSGRSGQRRLDQVKRLLGGELVDSRSLGYELDGWHVGVAAVGKEVEVGLRDLARSADRSLLLVRPAGETIWAWFGGQSRVAAADLAADLGSDSQRCGAVAFGEPAQALAGWQLSHRQAARALPVAQKTAGGVARFADVALLASALQDDLLLTSIRELYLSAIERRRDGDAACETLAAYFASDRTISAAAAAVGVDRKTVANRLRSIERVVGRSVTSCAAELELALAVRRLDRA